MGIQHFRLSSSAFLLLLSMACNAQDRVAVGVEATNGQRQLPSEEASPSATVGALIRDLDRAVYETGLQQRYVFLYTQYRKHDEAGLAMERMSAVKRESSTAAIDRLRSIQSSNLADSVKDSAKKLYTSWGAYLDALTAATSPRESRIIATGPAGTAYGEAKETLTLELELSQ